MPRRSQPTVGVDTGGTFTDAVYEGPDGRRLAKVPSTPAAPAEGFLAALDAADARDARVRHGTTVGTNAVLTRGGARVVLVTTAGFEDLPWLGRGTRDDLHALAPERAAPLAAASVGVRERVDARGKVVEPLAAAEVERVVARVARLRPAAVAVCLLHGVRHGGHERTLARALRRLDVPVFTSREAGADPREGERGATAVLHAYVAPAMRRYLEAVRSGLPRARRAALTVMRSDGGRMAVREVAAQPARTLLSGPAAGVAAAQDLARRHGIARALSFDVGGTSTDVAWIEDGEAPTRAELRVGVHAASVPSVGIETVGAGGGSLVWIDTGGALRVGPQSAGADPGPACYGRGGPFALTDAWLLRGRIPDALLAGAFPLDRAAAQQAARVLAAEAGMGVRALCDGAVRVAAAATARALRLASVAHGHDPRDAALVAFGGAGPVLAADTAERLGVRELWVPPSPGTFAAEGALRAPLCADAAEVVAGRRAQLAPVRKRLEARVRATLTREGAHGIRLAADVDARYAGQAFTVSVPLTKGWREAFHARHAARYGFATPERRVEVVRVRVHGQGRESPLDEAPLGRAPRTRVVDSRRALREKLVPGARVVGPARIDEHSGTTWVPGGWQADVRADGALRLRRTR